MIANILIGLLVVLLGYSRWIYQFHKRKHLYYRRMWEKTCYSNQRLIDHINLLEHELLQHNQRNKA